MKSNIGIRGGRLQATAFLAEDVRRFFQAAVENPLTDTYLCTIRPLDVLSIWNPDNLC